MDVLKSLLKTLVQVVIVFITIILFYVFFSTLNLLTKIEDMNKSYIEGNHLPTVYTEGEYTVVESDNLIAKFADDVETEFYKNGNELIFNRQKVQDLYDDAFESTIIKNIQFQSNPFLKYLSELTDYLYPTIEIKAIATVKILQNNLDRPIIVEDFEKYVYTDVEKYITQAYNLYFDKCPLYPNIETLEEKSVCFIASKLKTPYSEFTKNYKKEESMGLK